MRFTLFILSITAVPALLLVSGNLRGKELSLPGKIHELVEKRNTIFARHGYIFKSSAMESYYSSKSWYQKNPSFSWRDLSKEELQQIESLKKEEIALVARHIRELMKTRSRVLNLRWFKQMSYTSKFDATTLAGMREEVNKDAFLNDASPPAGTGLELTGEFPGERINRWKETLDDGHSYSWYEAGYDAEGKLRMVQECYMQQTSGKLCDHTHYLNRDGAIVLVDQPITQTTVRLQWYVQYFHGSPAWLVYTMYSMGNAIRSAKVYP
jgi:hypothetical protein